MSAEREGAAPSAATRKRLLALASAGGHWSQLMLMRPAFADAEVFYASTMKGAGDLYALERYRAVPDCNRNERVKIVACAAAILWLMIRVRPHVVVTTGALPGLIALAIGKFFGAKTVWIDSVANSFELSMAGASAHKYAAVWLSQWPEVAETTGAGYQGSVL